MAQGIHLSKAPLIDAIVELRFNAELPSQVVAGLLFSALKDHGYEGFEELPITQLPQQVREQDENLRYAAHYRIKSKDYLVSVSQRVVAISYICKDNNYEGWNHYKEEVSRILQEIQKLGFVQTFSRIGVRYINLFETEDILSRVHVSITAPDQQDLDGDQTIGFVYKNDGMSTRINFATKARVTDMEGRSKSGAILDIDTFTEEPIAFASALGFIENGHEFTEKAFTRILSKKFLEELK